jgi:hypothetical protein
VGGERWFMLVVGVIVLLGGLLPATDLFGGDYMLNNL